MTKKSIDGWRRILAVGAINLAGFFGRFGWPGLLDGHDHTNTHKQTRPDETIIRCQD